jgi:curli production assembly/transport component CsgF
VLAAYAGGTFQCERARFYSWGQAMPMLSLNVKSRRWRSLTLAVCPGAVMMLFAWLGPSHAGSLVYTPTNPSFGGNPNNGPNLLAVANAQNLPLAAANAAAAAKAAGSGSSSSSALTAGQIFSEQLQSQLLSSFANQITQAIFGPNAQTSGTFTFGTTSISFQNVNQEIQISINDGTTITNITVPTLD